MKIFDLCDDELGFGDIIELANSHNMLKINNIDQKSQEKDNKTTIELSKEYLNVYIKNNKN